MAEDQEQARRNYRERAQELRDLAGRVKNPESETALIAIALQYDRLAEAGSDPAIPTDLEIMNANVLSILSVHRPEG